ncbi:MAG: hypothetical protein KatS3mg110_2124 [Pirellulaceae bacterium]|nr:MAG: hypothetical protein KatS3mg110_2124 [Pirellulaceae bacterium]
MVHDDRATELTGTDEEVLADLLKQVACCGTWSYRPAGPSATEPASLAAIALLAHGQLQAAQKPLRFLRSMQRPDGTVPASSEAEAAPWTTAWAVLAWAMAAELEPATGSDWLSPLNAAVQALMRLRGLAAPTDERLIQHDTRLTGWSWVPGTHSWVEPTALTVLALTAAGMAGTARVQEGLQLLLDRQLSCGGWNYGNTVVLGHELRPHVQPSGMATAALVAAGNRSEAVRRACHYLETQLTTCTGAASFSWCWLGLAAHRQDPADTCRREWRKLVTSRSNTPRGPYHWALLLWAAAGRENHVWQVIRQRLSANAPSPPSRTAVPSPVTTKKASGPTSPPVR